MPKRFSIVQKRKWLEAFEQGESVAFLAEKYDCDVRTIRKAIDDAKWEREASLRRGELAREALRNHNDALLNLIRELVLLLLPLYTNKLIPSRRVSASGFIEIPGGRINYEASDTENEAALKVTEAKLDIENELEWGLLLEHLKQDAFYKKFNHWKNTLVADLQARIAMKDKLTKVLQDNTGLHILDKSANLYQKAPIPPSLDPYSLDAFSQFVLEKSLGIDTVKIKDRLSVNKDNGEITYNGGPLVARCKPEDVEDCSIKILAALDRLISPAESADFVDKYRQAEDAAKKAKGEAQELLLLGLVPGRCRICHRLGL